MTSRSRTGLVMHWWIGLSAHIGRAHHGNVASSFPSSQASRFPLITATLARLVRSDFLHDHELIVVSDSNYRRVSEPHPFPWSQFHIFSTH
jgi:hypothetical protein